MAWTLTTLRAAWRDAPADDTTLNLYLVTATDQCTAYAPVNAATDHPERFNLAVLVQVRNLWNGNKVQPEAGGYGDEGFTFRVFPMDWQVKNILRPKTAVPVIA